MPTITDLRCRACTVTGGMTVATRDQAESLSDIPHVKIAIGEGRQTPFEVGDQVELRPCITDAEELAAYRAEHARGERPWPCPKVDLDFENFEAMELYWIAVNEDAGRYASVMSEALLGTFTREERLAVLRRVLRALGDEKVIAARRKLQQDAIAKARMHKS
jgi:hypothetical protein